VPDVTIQPDRAKDLMRLGWSLAELRGRIQFGDTDPGRLFEVQPQRTGHALPLGEERSPAELLIETKQVVLALAIRTSLSLSGDNIEDLNGNKPTAGSQTAAQRLVALADAVPKDPQAPTRGPAWNAFTEGLYLWDAMIQDQLATLSFGESSAYQLGRGLAETSWMLTPNAPANSMASWQYLLGAKRCIALTRLLERLDPALPDPCVEATKGSLAAWERVAKDDAWRSVAESPIFLRQQTTIWRDLLIIGTAPQRLDKPSLLQRMATIVPVIKAMFWHIVFALIFAVGLAVGAWLLTRYGTSGPGGEIVSAVGLLGVTATGLSAKAKATANSLVQRLTDAVSSDLVVSAATYVPKRPRRAKVKGPGLLSMPGSVAEPITMNQIRF
jgi:hypothetical protein